MTNDEIRELPLEEQVAILFRRNQAMALKITGIAETVQKNLNPYIVDMHDATIDRALQTMFKDGAIDSDQLNHFTEQLKASNPYRKNQEDDHDLHQEGS
ncbi:hypothetical protein PBI_CANTARE_93 [Brevibacterium phage Cantare]|uniref:Uncharacterized protein n=1 Tax=Brevibacterium phage Cantare TaxID=2338395 RepID=A0A3G3LZP4_9CAUD|nr:hypothetical protein PQD70_gp093 [Brevibacterium phage Cantare]AYQ99313.1 hypothetical protein PBI_CANTARE_93 [Brevibacterium phage Cantare]